MTAIPMEMPKNCFQCSFNDGIYCALIDNDTDAFISEDPTKASTKRLDSCPLIDIVTCGECKWWDKDGDRPFGYCHAEKHCYFSTNWEISIYRTYKSGHFCSDGERRSE